MDGSSVDELAGCGSYWRRPGAILLALLLVSLAADTDIFTVDVLAHFGNTLRSNGSPNFKGSVIRSLLLVLAFAILATLITHGVL